MGALASFLVQQPTHILGAAIVLLLLWRAVRPYRKPLLTAAWADRLRAEITDRIEQAAPDGLAQTPRNALVKRLRHAAIQAERRELIRLWRENEISDEVMHHLEEILDYQEAHL